MNTLAVILVATSWMVPGAIFGFVLFGAWAILSLMADRNERPLERLKRLNPTGGAGLGEGGPDEPSVMRQQTRVQEILEMAAPALSKPLMPKSEYEQSQLKLRLATAGWRSDGAVTTYLGLKSILTILGACIG